MTPLECTIKFIPSILQKQALILSHQHTSVMLSCVLLCQIFCLLSTEVLGLEDMKISIVPGDDRGRILMRIPQGKEV